MNIWEAFLTIKISGVPISFGELKKLKKEKSDFDSIVKALIVHNKARLKCDRERIISHWKNGGDPLNIVYGLLTALKNNKSLTISEAIEKDKKGIDIPKEVTGKDWKK